MEHQNHQLFLLAKPKEKWRGQRRHLIRSGIVLERGDGVALDGELLLQLVGAGPVGVGLVRQMALLRLDGRLLQLQGPHLTCAGDDNPKKNNCDSSLAWMPG